MNSWDDLVFDKKDTKLTHCHEFRQMPRIRTVSNAEKYLTLMEFVFWIPGRVAAAVMRHLFVERFVSDRCF